MVAVADVQEIRSHLPALARRHKGYPVAYFDGPGGTQVPRAVADAVNTYLLHHNANTHWAYPASQETDVGILAARIALADWVGGLPEEIVFGANMTTLTFHLGRALAREQGVEIRTVRMRREDGRLDEDDLCRKLTPGCRLLAFAAAANAFGTINDVLGLVRRAKAVGTLAFVDAVHYAAHLPPDAAGWDCDFLACSAYKFYGPHVRVLWGRGALIERLDPPRLEPASSGAPESLETGTLSHEGVVGAAAAVDFVASLGGGLPRRERLLRASAELHARGAALFEQLWDGLGAIPGVTRFGPPPGTPRTPTLAFTVAAQPSRAVATRLAEAGVWVSHGNFYAPGVARVLGHEKDGLVRAGCAAYTTAGEVARLVAAVRRIAA